ncbi:MAG: Holliday junction branch migration protein RuvA [Candidatus Gastranaerophilales bacterium]|nr:Holliday junction branch migration protein RuvA [Candidatus Gastranaerophilales bacterium]
MISYLKGILASKAENSPSGTHIIVEVNNIGYFVLTNKKVISSLPEVGDTIKIYTSLIHREDVMYLCGFDAREDRDLFNILQSVSGIGTKVALMLLGELGAYELVSSVIRDDAKSLTRTKGVGPKLAQRLILELKDKMVNWRDQIEYIPEEIEKINKIENKESYLEAESVILSLGYSRSEANESLDKALMKAENKNNSEELLRLALQWLATR